MKDLRRHPRYRLRWPATLVVGGAAVSGKLLDISIAGASVLSDMHLRHVEHLTLQLLPPPIHTGQSQKIITVQSKLVYLVHSSEHMCFRAGFQFVRFEESGRQLLEERLLQHSPILEKLATV